MTNFNIKRLIFDADDTLWENNIYYIRAAEAFADLIHETGFPRDQLEKDFQILEHEVVREKGYGSENYLYILHTLFNRYTGTSNDQNFFERFERICDNFKAHVEIPPKLFPDVPSILENLANKYHLYVLTKGNIEEQKLKLEKSNLLIYFREAFVETEKNLQTYIRILKEKQWESSEICMIGNSPKSDINPALKLGMCAVYIPYEHTWVFDDEPLLENQSRLRIVKSFSDLNALFIQPD